MALAEHHTVPGADHRCAGVVQRLEPVADGIALAFDDGAGATRRLVVADAPDTRAARLATAGMRRIDWARIDHGPLGTTASVAGTANRLPVRRRLPVAAALALAAGGVPTLVCVRREG